MNANFLKECIDACLACAMACEKSAAAVANDLGDQKIRDFVKLELDCSDLCIITASFISRSSKHFPHLARECAKACEICAAECEKFAQISECSKCASECRKCATKCRQAISVHSLAA